MSEPRATLVSVPAHDAERARRALPEAVRTARGLPGIPPDPRCEVLSLTIHDRLDPAGWDSLRAVITRSDGYDHLDLDALAGAGVAVYHLGDYATRPVAELTLGMIVALTRRVPEASASTRGGSWVRDRLVSRGLDELCVGVLGTGRIGGAVVQMLQALGVEVLGHDLVPDRTLDVPYVALDELLTRADVLTLHVPGTPETAGMIDREAIARMPAGACLVNTARGSIVDQHAVREALDDGRLGGYAADVLPDEPTPELDVWRDSDRVLLTPHLGAHTATTLDRRWARTAAIVRAVLDGRDGEVAGWRVD